MTGLCHNCNLMFINRVCGTTIIRLLIILRFSTDTDLTYHFAQLSLFTDAEPLVGIINACLPFFPPVFAKIFHRNPRKTATVLSTSTIQMKAKASKYQPASFRHLDYVPHTGTACHCCDHNSVVPSNKSLILLYEESEVADSTVNSPSSF